MFRRILLLLTCVLTACSTRESPLHRPIEFSGTAMTMNYRILIGQELTGKDFENIKNIISSTFDEVHEVYDVWNPQSELSLLNRQPGNIWIPLSTELEKLLLITDKLVKRTEGYFDPSIKSAHQLWTNKLEAQSYPNAEEIDQLKEVVGWGKVRISQGRYWKSHQDVQIDLGGIAKGYCVDLLTERLVGEGFENCYIEWGGEIRTNGKHPHQRPWNVYISNLEDVNPDRALAIVALSDEALATSGDYLQQWTYQSDDGEDCTFTHIIDPKSLMPIQVTENNICSVTVRARTCTEADALATAVMIYPSVQEAKEWSLHLQESLPETQFWFVTRRELTR